MSEPNIISAGFLTWSEIQKQLASRKDIMLRNRTSVAEAHKEVIQPVIIQARPEPDKPAEPARSVVINPEPAEPINPEPAEPAEQINPEPSIPEPIQKNQSEVTKSEVLRVTRPVPRKKNNPESKLPNNEDLIIKNYLKSRNQLSQPSQSPGLFGRILK